MNNLELILEELASTNYITIYHSSKESNLPKILASDDFNPGVFGAGYMHGKGFYSVWKKGDLTAYGKNFYKGVVNLSDSKILILDPAFSKEIHKPFPENFIAEQIKKAFGENTFNKIFKDTDFPKAKNYRLYKDLNSQKSYLKYTSRFLETLEEDLYIGNLSLSSKFDGVAYNGGGDGHCLLMWNYRKVKIIGKFNRNTSKTEIDVSNFRKQKRDFLNNERIYSKNGAIIKEKNGLYLFMKNKEIVASISREQKNVPEVDYKEFDKIKKFFKENKIPKEIIQGLTFTNGKKINNIRSYVGIVKKRYGFVSNEEVKPTNIAKDFSSGKVIRRINSLLKKGMETDDYIKKVFNYIKINGTGAMLKSMEKQPLKISKFGFFPKEIEFDKNVIFDMGKYFVIKGGFPLDNSNLYFKGKFTNPKTKTNTLIIDSDTLISVFRKGGKNGTIDTTPFFDKEVWVRTQNDKNTLKYLKDIKSFKGCIFFNSLPEYFSSDITPPLKFLPSEKIIDMRNVKKIDFGKMYSSWEAGNLKKITFIYSKKLNIEDLEELKQKNETSKFILKKEEKK